MHACQLNIMSDKKLGSTNKCISLFFRSISCQLLCTSTAITFASLSQKLSQSFLRLALPHSQQQQQQSLNLLDQPNLSTTQPPNENEDFNHLAPNFKISPSSSRSSSASPKSTAKSSNIHSNSPKFIPKSPKLERASNFDDISTITVHSRTK
jgi:hypothetical protein